jgi:hypothetical protein
MTPRRIRWFLSLQDVLLTTTAHIAQSLSKSARLTYLETDVSSVYDNRDGVSEPTPFPSLPSSFTHVHRCIGYRNPHWQSLSKSARLTYPSVYDSRDRNSEPSLFSPPPSSLTHVHNIHTPTLPTLLTFTCTQVLWFLSSLTRSRVSGVTTRPATRLTIISTHTIQCMWGV